MIFFVLSLFVVSIIVAIVFVAPKTYKVERSIIIDKPYTGVFHYLKYIKNHDHWAPWRKKDPHMKQEYIGVDGEVGFITRWDGNADVGKGEREVMRIVENDRLEFDLQIIRPWKSNSKEEIKVMDFGRMQTKVIWRFWGKTEFPSNLFMLFYDMDKAVGKDFEEGLSNLKALMEKA